MCSKLLGLCLLNCNLILAMASLASAAAFVGLGDIPGGGYQSIARGISRDGQTVVGVATAFGLPSDYMF